MSDKEVRADAKLKNLPADVLDTLWRLRNPEEDGEKLTLEAVLVELKDTHGIEVSLSTLSEFYKWLRLKRGIESAKARAQQARYELAKSGELDLEAIEQVAQGVFTAEMTDAGNIKGFLALRKIQLLERKIKDDERRTKIDERKIQLLEAKAARLDKAESDIAAIRENAGLSEEDQRKAILDKVDEIFGIKK
jgi:hypothetical protein